MTWFTNCRTGLKLALAFGAMALLVGLVGYQGLRAALGIGSELSTLYERDARGLAELKSANIELLRMSRAIRNAVLDRSEGAIERRAGEITVAADKFQAHLAAYRARIVRQEDRAQAATITEIVKSLRARQDRVIARVRAGEIVELSRAGRDLYGETGVKEVRAVENELEALFETLEESKAAVMKATGAGVAASTAWTQTFILAVIAVGVALAAGVGYVITQLIARPLRQSVQVLEAVAEGDFTRRLEIDRRDEIGQVAAALNAAVEGMRGALQQVRTAARHAASASHQMAAASEQLSSGAQQQASSLEQTAASLEEITGTVRQSADSARQANELAVESGDTAEKGGRIVASAVGAMDEINQASRKIAAIITTIDEIAFQTNLLALNAAVEAARAGEQGRGFAVVAAEVRNLAQRAAMAAKEIKDLIRDSVTKVETGAELVTRSGEMLGEIVSSFKRVTNIIAEISSASREQTTGIEQVNLAVTQMDQVVQSNAAQTEELSSTAQALAEQAGELQTLVGRFKLGHDGEPTVRAPAPSPTKAPFRTAQAAGTRQPKSGATRRAAAIVEVATGEAGRPNGHRAGASLDEF